MGACEPRLRLLASEGKHGQIDGIGKTGFGAAVPVPKQMHADLDSTMHSHTLYRAIEGLRATTNHSRSSTVQVA